MASHQIFLEYSNQVRDYSCYNSGQIFHGCSKAQASLSKILRTISSFAPDETGEEQPSPKLQIDGLCCGNRGFGIDLNLRLGLSPPEIECYSEAPVGGVVDVVVDCDSPELCDGFSTVEKSSDGECDTKAGVKDSSTIEGNHEVEVVGEKATEVSEITNLQFQSFETINNGVCEETEEDKKDSNTTAEDNRDEGFLGLLIEAARLVSGEESATAKPCKDDELSEQEKVGVEKTETTTKEGRVGVGVGVEGRRRSARSKRREDQCDWEREWCGDFEDVVVVSPVVRTKRGRSQVLPYRYRDSVIEPWKRLRKRSSPKRKKLRR